MSRVLEKITICAVDCVNPHLAARAISESQRLCHFGRSIFISDTEVQGNFVYHKIPKLRSKDEYSNFLIKNLNDYVDTDFVLVVQWDGYVIDASQWSDDFLNFDYIGARWGWIGKDMSVGNGGFSLRSKKLLAAVSSKDFPFYPDINEDILICRVNRPILENRFNILFATEKMADQFSYEKSLPSSPTFGFHGFHNLWRYVDDSEMVNILSAIDSAFYSTRELLEIMVQYFLLGKFKMFGKIYRLAKQNNSVADFNRKLSETLAGNGELLNPILDTGDRIVSKHDGPAS